MSIKINKNNLVYTLTNTDSDKTPYKIKKKKKSLKLVKHITAHQ